MLRFVAAINQKDACIVVFVPDAATNYLVHRSYCRHFIPVVSSDPLVSLRLPLISHIVDLFGPHLRH